MKVHVDPKNSGVLIIDLKGSDSSQVPSHWTPISQPQQAYHGAGQPQYQPQQHYNAPQYQQQQQQQQQGGNDSLIEMVIKAFCACLNSK